MRNVYNILIIKLKRKRPLGKSTYRWGHINATIKDISATSSLMKTYTKSSIALSKYLLHMNFLRQ